MSKITQIYVRLLDEGVDVWRPVQARSMGGQIYLIVDQPYDRDVELWEFEPLQEVVCAPLKAEQGEILVATKKVSSENR